MGPQPGVDAGYVEAVGAVRQHAEVLPRGELGEADGALPLSLALGCSKGDGGERVDGLLL